MLKVENVLNPPHKPTNKNNRVDSEMGEMNRIAIAIKMQAATLANKVANGITSCSDFEIQIENEKRITEPKPPPKNTQIKLLRFIQMDQEKRLNGGKNSSLCLKKKMNLFFL